MSAVYFTWCSCFFTKGNQFILSSLQRSDNNKVVSCQAVTPYTDVYPTSGKSSEYELDVLCEFYEY